MLSSAHTIVAVPHRKQQPWFDPAQAPRSLPIIPFTCHSAPEPYALIVVVALGQFRAFLIVPDIQPHRAVAIDGGDGGDSFSQIGSGFSPRPDAAHGAGACDCGLARSLSENS